METNDFMYPFKAGNVEREAAKHGRPCMFD
jgi:hypothetical protein